MRRHPCPPPPLTPGARIASAGVAVFGSLLFGAALAQAVPGAAPGATAAWLTLSTGAAWLLFGPLLARAARLPLLAAADACLVAMTRGMAVLLAGALVLALLAPGPSGAAARFGLLVLASNGVMLAALHRRLARAGVPFRLTAALWFGVLNGAGALFAGLFGSLLLGGAS